MVLRASPVYELAANVESSLIKSFNIWPIEHDGCRDYHKSESEFGHLARQQQIEATALLGFFTVGERKRHFFLGPGQIFRAACVPLLEYPFHDDRCHAHH